MLATKPNEKAEHGEHERKNKNVEGVLETAPVVKVIEVIGTSTESFDDAIAKGITTAARSLRHITGADIKHMTVAVQDGKVRQYKVDLKIAFALEAEGEDD